MNQVKAKSMLTHNAIRGSKMIDEDIQSTERPKSKTPNKRSLLKSANSNHRKQLPIMASHHNPNELDKFKYRRQSYDPKHKLNLQFNRK